MLVPQITIGSNGYNQVLLKNRSGRQVLVQMRYGSHHDEICELLESNGIQYNDKHAHVNFQMPDKMFEEKAEMFLQIAQLNKEWWVG